MNHRHFADAEWRQHENLGEYQSRKKIDSDSALHAEIAVPDNAVHDICLCLNLLCYDLIPSFKIGLKPRIELIYEPRLSSSYANVAVEWNSISAHLCENSLVNIAAFYFTYMRDGISAVAPIDLELSALNSENTIHLTFTISSIRLPIANMEANK